MIKQNGSDMFGSRVASRVWVCVSVCVHQGIDIGNW